MLPPFAFPLFISCHLLCSGKLPQCYWTATLFLFFPISPNLPRFPFLKAQFEVSHNIPPYSAPVLAYPVFPIRAKPSSSFLITSRMLTITNLSMLPRVTGLVYKPLCQKIKKPVCVDVALEIYIILYVIIQGSSGWLPVCSFLLSLWYRHRTFELGKKPREGPQNTQPTWCAGSVSGAPHNSLAGWTQTSHTH